MPWRVEGTAAAGLGGGCWGLLSSRAPACGHQRGHGRGGGGSGMLGAAELDRAGGGGRAGRAGSPIARGRCGSCFTCGSRVA